MLAVLIHFLVRSVSRCRSVGQSDWTDPSVQAIVDTVKKILFTHPHSLPLKLYSLSARLTPIAWWCRCSLTPQVRIYDYSLDQPTINNLAGLFNLSAAAVYGDAAVASIVPYPPVYNADFAVNRNPVNSYNWNQYALGDTAAIGKYHTGVVFINSSANSYVDLNAASGVNSVGLAYTNTIGGDGQFPADPTRQGWSFEVVFKLNVTTSQDWAKMFELGNGAGLDNIAVTWGMATWATVVAWVSNFTQPTEPTTRLLIF